MGVKSIFCVLYEMVYLVNIDDVVIYLYIVFDELINSDDFWEGLCVFVEK